MTYKFLPKSKIICISGLHLLLMVSLWFKPLILNMGYPYPWGNTTNLRRYAECQVLLIMFNTNLKRLRILDLSNQYYFSPIVRVHIFLNVSRFILFSVKYRSIAVSGRSASGGQDWWGRGHGGYWGCAKASLPCKMPLMELAVGWCPGLKFKKNIIITFFVSHKAQKVLSWKMVLNDEQG